MTSPAAARVTGQAVVYRLFDVGYQIHLDAALDQLASSGPERVRPVRGEAQALQIHNPPVTVVLGSERLVIDGGTFDTEVSARIFDFGVLSLRARIDAPRDLTWDAFTTFGMAVDATARIPEALEHHARLLVNRLGVAVERPGIAPVREDYNVYRIRAITDASGRPLGTDVFRELDLTALLLAESRPLSAEARTELLPHRFSYYADDLAVITWENALVVDPATNDTEMEYVLEFANAQLLELRYYDRIERARFGPRTVFRRRYASLLGTMQTLVADSTELVERVENSIKVTDDVYLARVYAAALELFRGRAWRTGIDRKLTIIRDTYAMLNAESQAARAETLELAIIALIVAEIILSFVR